MNAKGATRRIRELVLGPGVFSFEFSKGCRDGMRAHDITASDVFAVVRTTECEMQTNGRWRFEGEDSADRGIRIVVEVDLSVQATFVSIHLSTEKGL